MLTLNDVYAKFGEVAEAAQLLETQIGNLLIEVAIGTHDANLIAPRDMPSALFNDVDKKTLGQLVKELRKKKEFADTLEEELALALSERNRLNHSFYRDHNFRRNTEAGRAQMIADLEKIHQRLHAAYVPLMQLSGISLEVAEAFGLPTDHLNLKPVARKQ